MPDRLHGGAQVFFRSVWDTLGKCLPLFGAVPVTLIYRENDRAEFKVSIPLSFQASAGRHMYSSRPSDLYSCYISIETCPNRDGDYLAVHSSQYALRVGSAPIVRFEYDRDKSIAHPVAHIHFHGAGTWLSPALMRNKPKQNKEARQGKIEGIHFPVGGHRFRPSLEDFLFFLLGECGFEGKTGWENVISRSRNEWMDIQLRAAVRDNPAVAVEKLRELGYGVVEPEQGPVSYWRRAGW
ncbi:hypothetical protein Clow_00805 [Corynebacterium lowii]|uniref:Uncharacterized protein n=1 Tax=Corynebacterium lowii TaxID=1544413 RepID=A0A0Q0ZA09_9CORY|nr:hypothetical protein Clow_00805 [Corynebacterium lowii]MDP9851281.1 hypothetical protein [Corynebacterium lowii]